MQRNTLTEIQFPLIEGFPVEFQMQVVRQVDAEVGAGCDGIEGAAQLEVVDPDFGAGAALGEKEVEAAGVVEVQVADDDFADVFMGVAGGGNGGGEFVLGFVVDAGEDVGDLGAPD